ncbi:MAG: hypothetical protein FWE11_02245 [Defluviitaleaceae bacterium]|nr:hypothetical protein [Defluviitaleaceae bacterium]
MPFPLTHLLVADELLKRRPKTEAGVFLLGSIAPDAVHYRKNASTEQEGLGPTKKITHLCPVSDEKWGYVTDNEGWIESIRAFNQKTHHHPLYKGYAAHCLTDLYNNMTLWTIFRTNHPKEAAKGYKSDYYKDLNNIDQRLFKDMETDHIWDQLKKSTPQDMPGLVTAQEIHDIRDNILYEQYKTPDENPNQDYHFLTYEESLGFIQKAADFIEEILQ